MIFPLIFDRREQLPTFCPKHGTPQLGGVMIGGVVYACDCAIYVNENKNVKGGLRERGYL